MSYIRTWKYAVDTTVDIGIQTFQKELQHNTQISCKRDKQTMLNCSLHLGGLASWKFMKAIAALRMFGLRKDLLSSEWRRGSCPVAVLSYS
jgi:hypothetical protein